jgi:hypothetical protein
VAVLSPALQSLDEAGVERLRTAVLVLDRMLDQATVATTPPTRKES